MRKYAEIYQGFVVAFIERDDMLRPEFVPPRFAVRIDMLSPQPIVGDEFDGRRFIAPTRPNPNLLFKPPTSEELIKANQGLLEEILELLKPVE